MDISASHYKIKLIFICFIFVILTAGCFQQAHDETNHKDLIDIHVEMVEPDRKEIRKLWEELIQEYMAINPQVHVHLDFVTADASMRRSRMTTALMSATAPDLIETEHPWAQADYRKGLLVDLTPYLNRKNPYFNNVKWKDTFDPRLINQLTDPTNQAISSVSINSKQIIVVYNKDYFRKWHLSIPDNWEMFMELHEKIKNRDIIPFAFANDHYSDINFAWLVNDFFNQSVPHDIKQFDLNHDNVLQLNEIVGLIDQGALDFNQYEWHSFMTPLKAWSEFWPHDYHLLDHQSAIDTFLSGDAAMLLTDRSHYDMISSTAINRDAYDIFPLPSLTAGASATSNWILDKTFSIPHEVRGERLETIIDLLMYFTSVEAAEKFKNMNYKSTTVLEQKQFQTWDEQLFIPLFSPMLDKTLHESLNQIGQLYLDDTITLENYMEELNANLQAAVETMMIENNWNRANAYGTK